MQMIEFGNPDARHVLIEPIHTEEGIEHEAQLIREMTNVEFSLLAVKVDWFRVIRPLGSFTDRRIRRCGCRLAFRLVSRIYGLCRCPAVPDKGNLPESGRTGGENTEPGHGGRRGQHPGASFRYPGTEYPLLP